MANAMIATIMAIVKTTIPASDHLLNLLSVTASWLRE